MFGISKVLRGPERNDPRYQAERESQDLWLKLGIYTVYFMSLGFLLSSKYFEARLPVKVISNEYGDYRKPSHILEKIFAISESRTVKVVEPFL